MRTVGVRELKAHASEILRRVREAGERYQITYRGRVVAYLVPVSEPKQAPESPADRWARRDALAKELGERWSAGVSAVDAIREDRTRP